MSFLLVLLTLGFSTSWGAGDAPCLTRTLRDGIPVSQISKASMQAERELAATLLKIYYRDTKGRENLKHVRRLLSEVRAHADELQALGIHAGEMELSILISDIAKDPNILKLYAKEYGNNMFAAFMDHARLGIREAEVLKRDLEKLGHHIDDDVWKRIVAGVMGHDGPGDIPGTFWGDTYKKVVGRDYPPLEGRVGYLHAWLDRLDQGGIFRTRTGSLEGGPRKISFDVYNGIAKMEGVSGNLLETVKYSLDYSVHRKTLPQIERLKEMADTMFPGQKLPAFISKREAEMRKTPQYLTRVVEAESDATRVTLLLDDGTKITVTNLDDFWKTLSQVHP